MIKRLFKYATTDTARAILRTRTLRWSAPELFNDPFEFKSPLELGFEWEDFEQPYLEEASKVITQPDEPALVEGNPVAEMVRKARTTYKGANPVDVQRRFRPGLPGLIDRFRRTAELDGETWRQMKKDYRVLCFSAVPDNILMWSHYSQSHQGAVLAFEAKVELKTDLLGALPVSYARQVPNAASLEEYVGYLTGQRPKPSGENAFQKSVFTKSLDWAYENEWRILDKETTPAAQLYVDRPFDPRELASIYFGCRIPQESKASIIDAAARLGTPISFFEMRDERIRFELTPVPMEG